MVTENDIEKWYDPGKTGIIIQSSHRSGSTYLRDTITKHLRSLQIPAKNIQEILPRSNGLSGFDSYVMGDYSISTVDDSIRAAFSKLSIPNSFNIGSVLTDEIIHFLYNDTRYISLLDNYVVVKLIRRDYAAHLMSQVVHIELNRSKSRIFHNGLRPDDVSKYFKTPYVLTRTNLLHYMAAQQKLISLPSDFIVYYDELQFNTPSSIIKDEYGITPEEFFSDFPALDTILKNWKIADGR